LRWLLRASEETKEAGDVLWEPISLLLDRLRNEDPLEREATVEEAEAWLQANLEACCRGEC